MKLKPCPFCGSKTDPTLTVHTVFCHACYCEGPFTKRPNSAKRSKLWNTRKRPKAKGAK